MSLKISLIPSHPSQNGSYPKVKRFGDTELLDTVGRNAKWYNHCAQL